MVFSGSAYPGEICGLGFFDAQGNQSGLHSEHQLIDQADSIVSCLSRQQILIIISSVIREPAVITPDVIQVCTVSEVRNHTLATVAG